jgi:hypothetical protein
MNSGERIVPVYQAKTRTEFLLQSLKDSEQTAASRALIVTVFDECERGVCRSAYVIPVVHGIQQQ